MGIRAYHIFKNRSTNWHRDVENIQDLQPLWVIHNASLPSSIPELSKAFISLVQDYRKSIKLPINIPIGPHQTRKYSGAYSVQLKPKERKYCQSYGVLIFYNSKEKLWS